MARLNSLAAILILWGCGPAPAPPPPPAPKPPSCRLEIRTGLYMDGVSARHFWELKQLTPPFLPGPDGLPVFHPRLESKWQMLAQYPKSKWFLLSFRGLSNFWLQEEESVLRLYRHKDEPLLQAFGHLPRTLQAGMSWKSGNQTSYCTLVGDEFKVVFTEAGRTVHSMIFDENGGLRRWEGLGATFITRLPDGDPQTLLARTARTYADFGRVDDELRWAPTLCRAPSEPILRTSRSGDQATHGRKQYYLFARDAEAYLHAEDRDQPDGQIVVKESWVQHDKGPLYLMLKSQGTWFYATATPDGASLTASGRLASCIECHESPSARDRMFGLSSSAAPK